MKTDKANSVRIPLAAETHQPAHLKASPSPLGQRLRAIRAKIVASGEPLLDWEDIEREKTVMRRYQDTNEK